MLMELIFFKLKSNQKLSVPVMVVLALLLVACGSSKKKRGYSKAGRASMSVSPYKASPKKGEHAAVAGDKVESSVNRKADKVVETARTFLGTPYKYGGTTRSGMDCSGLLLNSFKTIAITLPRSSADQSKIGQEVKMADLRPGDLVFFATGKSRKLVTHVGLVTDISKGEVKFIHASSTLGVVETNISGAYYQERYVGARRVID